MLPPAPLATSPQTQDIRPIRDAVTIPAPPSPPAEVSHLPLILWIICGIVALAAIAALIIYLKRRAEANRIPNLQQKAIIQLSDCKKLMTPAHSREFTIAVSNILRTFIESRFQLPSTRLTTPEFLTKITHDTTLDLGPYQKSLCEFFNQCDFGKFSGNELDAESLLKLHQTALEVVHAEQAPRTNPPVN